MERELLCGDRLRASARHRKLVEVNLKKAVAVLVAILCIPAFAGQGATSAPAAEGSSSSTVKTSSRKTGKASLHSAKKKKKRKGASKAAASASRRQVKPAVAVESAESRTQAASEVASGDPLAQQAPAPAATPATPAALGVPPAAGSPGSNTVPQPAATILATPTAELERDRPWQVSLGLQQTVGHGTWVRPSQLGMVESSLSVTPSYQFKANDIVLNAAAGFGFGWEFTRPDSETGRHWSYSDPRLSLSAPGVWTWKATGLAVTPSVSASIPLSLESQQSSLITSASAAVNVGRSFLNQRLSVGYSLSGTRNFHTNPAIAVTRDDFNSQSDDEFRSVLCRSGETLCGSAGINTRYALRNSLSVGYQATEKLSFGIGYGLTFGWKYTVASERDEFTSKAVDSNGNPVADVGAARSADRVSGSISAGYQFSPKYGAQLSMNSGGRAKSNDNGSFRFPWFDFAGAAGNSVTYSLSFSATY